MKIYNNYSPNFSRKKRSNNSIKIVVIHYTGMQSERESLSWLCNPRSQVSSHLLIGQNGKVHRLVNDNNVAWHAGKSCWKNFKNINNNSIGIELVNKGHQFGYTNFKKKQILNLIKICKILIKKYKIKNNNFVGHSDIAPLRKKDPGEKFPWEKLAKKNIGLWHNFNSNYLKKFRKIKITTKQDKTKFIRDLRNIGYCVSFRKRSILFKVIKSFQRRYRKQLVNGVADKDCAIIAQNLSKKV